MAIYRVTTSTNSDFLMSVDLSQAASPICVRFFASDDKWHNTPYQTADARHRARKAAELAHDYYDDRPAGQCDGGVEDVHYIGDDEWMLRENADTDYESAQDLYDSHGDHVSTEDHGDISVDMTYYSWTDEGVDTETAIRENWDGLTEDEVEAIAAMCRKVREAADSVVDALGRAVIAYNAYDFDACVAALNEASSIESDHGDDPASRGLRGELLAEVE